MSSIASVAQRDMLAGDDNNAEQTCGAFSTALDAAKAHDTEALRVYGPAAEAMLNFPMANYPDVTLPLLHTSSLQLSRRRPARCDELSVEALCSPSCCWTKISFNAE
jgi:hypothetical protein